VTRTELGGDKCGQVQLITPPVEDILLALVWHFRVRERRREQRRALERNIPTWGGV